MQTTTQQRTFEGATLAQALAALKAELGDEARIVESRRVRRAGPHGREVYEVVGEAGASVGPGALGAIARWAYGRGGAKAAPRGEADRPAAGAGRPSAVDLLRREIADIRREVATLAEDARLRRRGDLPGRLGEAYEGLRARGVSDDVAGEIVRSVGRRSRPEELADARLVAARVRHEAAALLEPAGGVAVGRDGPTVLAVVGPTGVGKTTTLAKIGAHLALDERRSVAFVTLDTYRIAAAEQLRRYAEILSAPFEEVADPAEVRRTVEYHGEKDVILVDTAGRGPLDDEQMGELKAALDALPFRREVHLLLSATARDEDLLLAVRRFRREGETRLVFTKVDETERLGNLLNVAAASRLPISYVTTGQNVPDDIEVAERDRLLERILGPSDPAPAAAEEAAS